MLRAGAITGVYCTVSYAVCRRILHVRIHRGRSLLVRPEDVANIHMSWSWEAMRYTVVVWLVYQAANAPAGRTSAGQTRTAYSTITYDTFA